MAQKTIEVDEAQYLAQQQTVQALSQIVANPKAKKLLLEAQKVVNPNITIPQDYQDEVRTEFEAKLKKQSDEFEAFKKAQEEKEAKDKEEAAKRAFVDNWESAKGRLRGQGYQDEGIAAIEKLAQERGIPDLEAAAALFDRLNPPATPIQSGRGYGSMNLFEPPEDKSQAEQMKKLLESRGEDESTLNQMISSALRDHRSARAA